MKKKNTNQRSKTKPRRSDTRMSHTSKKKIKKIEEKGGFTTMSGEESKMEVNLLIIIINNG